jgi:uncharacterized protein YndB with AHSA1/START domain
MAQMIEAKKDAAVRQPPPLRFSRVFHARRETVFKAWSSTDHVKGQMWYRPRQGLLTAVAIRAAAQAGVRRSSLTKC